MLKNLLKNKNGITLIALVVTIVVLIILATISITLVLGDNGIFKQAAKARDSQANAVVKDEEDMDRLLAEYSNIMAEDEEGNGGGAGNDSGDGDELPEITDSTPAGTQVAKPTAWADKTNVKAIADGEGNAIPVPTNATYQEGTKETGVVIKDTNNNEWVWVPVSDATAMYEENAAGVALAGETGVTTTRYSKSAIISGITRNTPNTTGYCEPEILIYSGCDDTNYETAGFSSLNDMASKLVSEYITMTESVAKYGGFYIGRYELTANGTKPGETLTYSNWYTLYAKCKSLTVDENIALSRMIWGCQWDMTCIFIANYGERKSITDSSTWGNHKNYNTANNYTEGDESYEAGAGSKQDTGSSENWKANNIYDFAGNCWEWTQEASPSNARVYRRESVCQKWLGDSSFCC